MKGLEGQTLTSEEKEELEKPLSWEEYMAALNAMPNGKTPGQDGLSVKFLKTFVDKLKPTLCQCFDAGMKRGRLHDSARRGIISMIPKAEKDIRRLKNLRSITLLNIH